MLLVHETPHTTLAEQQQWLHRVITGRAEPDARIDTQVRGGTLTPERRVQVYRHAYVQRLIECLRDDFPVVESALGVESFEGHCRDYIVQCPPDSVSLNAYGERFPAFLARARASSANAPLPAWVAELARLEWATVVAIHADATETVSLVDLARIPFEEWRDLVLKPSSSLQLLAFGHAVNEYLTAVRGESCSEQGVGTKELCPPPPRASWALVCRRGPDVWRIDLEAWAHALLGELGRGSTLAVALEVVSSSVDLDPNEVMRCFRQWVACGVFSGCGLERRPSGA